VHATLIIESNFPLMTRSPGLTSMTITNIMFTLIRSRLGRPPLMDTLESYHSSLRNSLGAALREHRCTRQWHYAIDMEETNQDSLASYLGIGHKQIRSLLLLASGLARFHNIGGLASGKGND
jgi:hypothetical protein